MNSGWLLIIPMFRSIKSSESLDKSTLDLIFLHLNVFVLFFIDFSLQVKIARHVNNDISFNH